MKNDITSSHEDIIVEEPQLVVNYALPIKKILENNEHTLNVLSLFSGCGGMDLGFEGGFSVLNSSVYSRFIEKKFDNGFVQLKKTRFRTVFANDILTDARKGGEQLILFTLKV